MCGHWLRYCLLACALLLSGCWTEPSVPIGFLGALEGKFSDLGVQGRNGARLAIESVNARGGIGGRTFRLIPADDGNTPEGGVTALEGLAARQVKVVIGPMTSVVASAVVPVAEHLGLVLVSPTTATPSLSGLDDCFFRLLTVNTLWAEKLALHAAREDAVKNVVIVADRENEEYSQAFLAAFMRVFATCGGKEAATRWIRSRQMVPEAWNALAQEILSLSPDGLVLSLAARDAASLAKALQYQSVARPRVYSAMWAATTELLLEGGRAVEGWCFGMGYTGDIPRDSYQAFKKAYRERFGYDPNFAAALAYEALLAVFHALQANEGRIEALPRALAGLRSVAGVIGNFGLDAFGDAQREIYIVTVRHGSFKTVATIPWGRP
jgi:branched-chain amino acid transport system substrate-binding protein